MSLALLVIQLALATVLLIAANGKLLRSEEFTGALRLSHLPEWAVRVGTVAVPLVEVLLALALVVTPAGWLPTTLWATALVVLLFTLWMLWVRSRRLHVRCGCFGVSGGEVDWGSIIRNLVLVDLAVIGAWLASRLPSPLPPASWPLVLVAVPAALTVALVQAFVFVQPRLVVRYGQLRGTHIDGEG